MMTYQQTLDYLYSQLPMFSRIGQAAYKADLNNTIALCNFIGNPQQRFKTAHIAGTNGKGSTSHMLAAVLQQAGYKTGLYTSPHLKDFRERIKINGAMIGEEAVIQFVEKTQGIAADIQPSFFELTVAMAFDYFAAEQVDIAIIETGLGGRLDSTNIITPLLSLITNIGYDHMALLGNTLTAIAGEKAGIIKPHVPVIIGELLPETVPVFEQKALLEKAPLYKAVEYYTIANWQYEHHLLTATVTTATGNTTYSIDLPGLYQLCNLPAVLKAVALLSKMGFSITTETVQQALQQVKKLTGLHGRWEIIAENPPVILDVGHNEDGVKVILQQLQHTTYENLHIVLGMVKDKAIDKILALLPKTATYYFTAVQIPRALPANLLQEQAAACELKGNTYTNVNEALAAAKNAAAYADLILVCGSVFLVGEVER